MTTWIVGDVHGHFGALKRLAKAAGWESSDELWFVGDLVNGGGENREVVEWCAERDCVVTLGNHDLHMLAVWSGARERRDKDDFEDLLEAANAPELFDWLHTRSIVHFADGDDVAMVHAGLHPTWTPEQAELLGAEVERVLRGDERREFFEAMYGDKPANWRDNLSGSDRLRVIVNATTRMRVVDDDANMSFDYSGTYEEIPQGEMAWFDHPERQSADTLVVFGHWSALGLKRWSNVVALDSGVRWGRMLSAMRLEDRTVVQVPADPDTA